MSIPVSVKIPIIEEKIMKREVLTFKIPQTKPRHRFLFEDGEFKPKQEKLAKVYRRRDKHRRSGDYEDRFYL